MIKILKATTKESLDKEWHLKDIEHYGKKIQYTEEKFRFKAVENGKIVGTIEGKYELGTVFIGALIVASKSRGKGIGTALIKKAEDVGRKYNAHKTWLVTGKDWSENNFYRKLGFKKVSTIPDLYIHKDFVIYTRKIS